MKRRSFILKGSLGVIGLSLFPHLTWGKDSFTNQKLQFIQDLIDFGTEHLEINPGEDFFSEWADDESKHFYLFVSESVKIKRPKEIKRFLYFGTEKENAILKQKEYLDKGFHTLLFSRVGKKNFKITNTFLSLPNESLAISLYHDAAHAHFKKNADLHIQIEEAACDIMGTFGAKFYAQRNDSLDLKKVETRIKKIEKANELIVKCSEEIGEDLEENKKLYQKLERKLFRLFQGEDQFLINRFIHPVNNAYLIKALDFAKYYSLVKKVAVQAKYINTFIYIMENLPKNKEKAIKVLEEKGKPVK